MKQLFLADLEKLTNAAIQTALINEYRASPADLARFEILIAYESVGSWGCDSSSWFLLKDILTGELYENHASHCSCYGFEGQWEPELSSAEYLKSEHFHFCPGGYDDYKDENEIAIKAYIARNL